MGDVFDRRQFLGGSLGGFFALARQYHCEGALARQPLGRAKRCLVLWMNGGPSQFETFDPKAGGELAPIGTSVPGLQICETLPQLAQRMDKLAVLRNLTSREGEHERAQYYLHTGYRFVEAFPRPALGAMAAYESPRQPFPGYVTIGSPGYGPAFLGAEHAPFSIQDPHAAHRLMQTLQRRSSRLDFSRQLGANFDAHHDDAALARRQAMFRSVTALLDTPFVEAVHVDREPDSLRRRYGEGEFARSCLLARRLLEAGVPFVEVHLDGWDTHADNFRESQRLCAQIDGPWSALIDDLTARGLWDDTLLVWMGEFGRTPRVNPQRGRDHFPQITPVVLGGGPIAAGGVIGATNRAGTQIEGDAHAVPDLFATILTALGIAPDTEYTTDFNSPTTATEEGSPIKGLI